MPVLKAMRIFILISLFLWGLLGSLLYAEFLPLMGYEGNFEDSLSYRTNWYRVRVPDASVAFSGNGIALSGEGDSSVKLHKSRDLWTLSGWAYYNSFISHVPSGDSSAGEGLVIHFDYPVSKFGVTVFTSHISDMNLGGRDGASLAAYTASGELVGTVVVDAENRGYDDFWLEYGTFGFEITDEPGITGQRYRVTVRDG